MREASLILTSRVAEIELGQVPLKMSTRDVTVRSVDGALQLGKEVLGTIDGDFAPDILADVVVDRLMLRDLWSNRPVLERRVRMKSRGAQVHVLGHDRAASRP